MATEDNVKLVKSAMEAFLTGNPSLLLASMAEDVVTEAAIPEGTPISGRFRGPNGFLQYFQAVGEVMEVLGLEDIDYAGSADKVVVTGFEKARVRRTDKVFETETATIFTLRGGKITRVVALADMSAIVDAYRAEAAR